MFLRSEKVVLCPMDNTGWELLTAAHLDPEFDRLTTDDLFPKTVADVATMYRKFQYPQGRMFQIFPSDQAKAGVGFIGLCNMDMKNKNAEVHIAIWSKEHRLGGLGMDAARVTMDYAFNNLGIHRLYALVLEGNALLINSAETVGFKVESVLKGCFFVDGKYKNGVLIAAINPTR